MRSIRRLCSVPAATVIVVAASSIPVAQAEPAGCRAWSGGLWSRAKCDETAGGEFRAVAHGWADAGSRSVYGYDLPFNDTQYGKWRVAGSGEESTARRLGGYRVSDPSVQLRP